VRQPSMLETMKLVPGVVVGESGRSKAATMASSKVQMTRKEYLRLSDPERGSTPCATPSGSAAGGQMGSLDSLPSVPAGDGIDDLANENSQMSGWGGSHMSMGCGRGGSMNFSHPSMRRPRERQPTAGIRDFLHRSLRPAPGGSGRSFDCAGSDSPASSKPGMRRLSGGISCGSIGNGGKMAVANRDLLRQLLNAS
jgi:hypothetical protein